jgi:hypothetical protein
MAEATKAMKADRVRVPRKTLEARTQQARRRSAARRTDRVRVPRKTLEAAHG